jgi:N-acetylmuramoyl-L-alanine amidase
VPAGALGMALIVLDRQHCGHPGREFADCGAFGDFDHDGVSDVVEQEAILTAEYGLACEMRLRELGHRVVVISDGTYAERHARAVAYKADVYIAMHLNAGGGDYGVCFWDHRSESGPKLAASIAAAFGKALPELARVLARPTAPSGEWTRPYPCIAGVYSGRPVACLVEPAFLDRKEHRGLFDAQGMDRVGKALADGIHAYVRGAA